MRRWAWFSRLGLGGMALWAALAAAPSPAAAQGTLVLLPDDTLQVTRQAIFSGLANQVGTLPNPTGGGFVFRFDPALGVFTRATDSFGPVFANRAETTGKGKLTLTTSYSRHTFDELDGVDLRNGELNGILGVALFNPNFVAATFGLISIREEVDADVFTLGGLYGVTDQIDVGLTLPVVHAKVKERVSLLATATCVPAGGDTVQCGNVRPANVTETHTGEQTGLGDLVLRGKYNFWQAPDLMGGRAGLAFALDVKLPTGDKGERQKFVHPYEQFFTTGFLQIGDPPLGTGIVRVRPELIASGSWFGLAPHVNVGAELGKTADITNDLVYEIGLDYTLFGRATLSADLLGRHAFDVTRRKMTIDGPDGTAGADTLAASFGVKVNPVGTLLVFLNFLIPVNDTGLRDDVTPTFGLEWTW